MKQLAYTEKQLQAVAYYLNQSGANGIERIAQETGLPVFKLKSLAEGSYLPRAAELRLIEQLRDAPAGRFEVTEIVGV